MDGSRFDTWTRGLAQSGSRRAAVRTLVAGWLAAAGVAVAGAPALGAPCKGHGKGCDKDGDCCRGLTCKRGKCACKGSATACGDTCCDKGEKCLGAGQKQACCSPFKVCNEDCCGPHRVCVCPIPPDIPGEPPPDPNALCYCRCEDGWEENAKGECVCKTTLCGLECCEEEKGERCCGKNTEICTNTNSSKKHCGECGYECPPGSDCVGGKCVCEITGSEPCFDGVCCGRDEHCCGAFCYRRADSDHCGRCWNKCDYLNEDCCDLPPEEGGPRCMPKEECRRLRD